jgi:hypothetical protein
MSSHFFFRRIGTTGCEILDSEGKVIAWAVDEFWAVLIVAELNKAASRGEIHD